MNSFGAFQTYYTLTLNQPASTISWIGTVQNWLTFFIGAFSGRLLDAGFFIPTLMVGSTLQLLGIFLMSVSTKYWHLMLTQGVLTGLGGGIFFTPSMGLLATYFSTKRAFAIGIATTGNAVGGMIYPLLVRELLPKLGYPWTVRVLGFLNLALLLVAAAVLRPRLPPRKSGPVVDLSAFKEPPYALFVAALFFAIWGVYYTFYYVSASLPSHVSSVYSDAHAILHTGWIIRRRKSWPTVHLIHHPDNRHQRSRCPSTCVSRLLRRQSWPNEYVFPGSLLFDGGRIFLACRGQHCRPLRIYVLLRLCVGGLPRHCAINCGKSYA